MSINQDRVGEPITHYDEKRKNIPTAEYQSVMDEEAQEAVRVAYERRNRDLDPQLVWRGKDEQDWSDLVVHAPPLYIQEKVDPHFLIKDLEAQSKERRGQEEEQMALFADFNGLPEGVDKTDFYQHEGKWQNRMILGDSLQVMASLAEREGLRGKVQCIYFDPPYGIKFNSNFQWSTTSRDVKDGKKDHITREPEMVKAFRDTWRDGIHSYLTYLRDRLTVGRDLLHESGSIFVQIGDENAHLLRSLLDEVFGKDNFCSNIFFSKTTGTSSEILPSIGDLILWYARSKPKVKFRPLLRPLPISEEIKKEFGNVELPNLVQRKVTKEEREDPAILPPGSRLFRTNTAVSPEPSPTLTRSVTFGCGISKHCGEHRHWKTGVDGLLRLEKANRLDFNQGPTRMYRRFLNDNQFTSIANVWTDTRSEQHQIYVVQTKDEVVKRCVLMSTDPGDLVLDPTCGSGTTAFVSEQWGRRWITVDTSRVALALARSRLMSARYCFYILSDSDEGQTQLASISKSPKSSKPTFMDIRQGFVYDRIPQVQLGTIARNSEIDVIWEAYQGQLEFLQAELNIAVGKKWEEREIPRDVDGKWSDAAKKLHAEWWAQRIARQKEIDASIAARAEFEYLYDKPYEDKKKIRVAGPFTVESLSPHRSLAVDENDELFDDSNTVQKTKTTERMGFVDMILSELKTSGVQQANKEDKINFATLVPWPGRYICAEGTYREGDKEKRAGIFLGPEFGTVSRPDLVEAAREAGEADFDVVISCAFSYDAHSSEFDKLGRIPVLKARMNADLHMAEDLKSTGKGNLFVIFGEPDIDVLTEGEQIRVKINGVDVFDPQTGEVRSDSADGIACWFVDTNYNGESFFVRHAYFLGANDPYKSLKTTLKAEIDEEAWESLHSDLSRPFPKPITGRIAVKVINHLGDEVMKVYRIKETA